MASKAALLLSLNILFFTVVSSNYVPCPPPPPKGHKHPPSSKPPSSKPPTKNPPSSKPPPSNPPSSNPPPSKPPPSSPPPTKPPPSKPPPSSPPPSSPPPSKQPSCPLDTLKLGVCADLLGLVNVVIGNPSNTKCCSLIQGLADLDAAICLCTALRANVLGINLNIPINLSLILQNCGKSVPKGFQCA